MKSKYFEESRDRILAERHRQRILGREAHNSFSEWIMLVTKQMGQAVEDHQEGIRKALIGYPEAACKAQDTDTIKQITQVAALAQAWLEQALEDYDAYYRGDETPKVEGSSIKESC